MSPAAKRKRAKEIEDSLHLGKDGFDWKGSGVRKYGVLVVAALVAIALGLLLVWTLHTFPSLMLAKTDKVAATGASIEKKLDTFKGEEATYHKKNDKALKELVAAVKSVQDELDLQRTADAANEIQRLARGR